MKLSFDGELLVSRTLSRWLVQSLINRRDQLIAHREVSLEQFKRALESETINRRRQALIAQVSTNQKEYERLYEISRQAGKQIGQSLLRSFGINGEVE